MEGCTIPVPPPPIQSLAHPVACLPFCPPSGTAGVPARRDPAQNGPAPPRFRAGCTIHRKPLYAGSWYSYSFYKNGGVVLGPLGITRRRQVLSNPGQKPTARSYRGYWVFYLFPSLPPPLRLYASSNLAVSVIYWFETYPPPGYTSDRKGRNF